MSRIDYSSWPRLSLSVSNLRLDKENPRIPSYITIRTTKDILNYLFQNERIERLAHKIVEKGFISHDPIYVVKEGENYVVVEGNRRVSALKCLIDPELVPSPAKRRKIELYKNRLGSDLIEKIDVFVAPSRRAVENVLFELHAEGKLQWSRQQKNKFIASIGIDSGESIQDIAERFNVKVTEIQDSVQEYLLERYFTELELPTDIEDKALMSKFNIST
ncbi:ParB N-terminal domain-containing protein, partial [Brenneria goodwinii]|uniref:ParB N-terminal domain-containing protein n=2 Tax=Pectobacteriaceae TaxID=1903410 RepID=UPI0016020892